MHEVPVLDSLIACQESLILVKSFGNQLTIQILSILLGFISHSPDSTGFFVANWRNPQKYENASKGEKLEHGIFSYSRKQDRIKGKHNNQSGLQQQ